MSKYLHGLLIGQRFLIHKKKQHCQKTMLFDVLPVRVLLSTKK